MQLYRTTMQTGADSHRVKWDGTQADARATRKAFGPDAKTADINVPTDKVGLLQFLNNLDGTESGE